MPGHYNDGDVRMNNSCPDGYEHWMSDVSEWMCGKVHIENDMVDRIIYDVQCNTTDDCSMGKNCILGNCV